MKTHELAKALTHLSRVLRAGPNIELDDLVNLSTYADAKPTRAKRDDRETGEKGAALALLSEMSNYSKKELADLAQSLGIPVEVRPAYSVRDVLGKILNYISENPDVKLRLAAPPPSLQSPKSSSLARALSILINQS